MAPVNPIRVTERAQKLATEILRPGDIAVDGTAGKGRDTACLAQAVGPSGHVHAFDIQPEAIASSRNLLEVAGLIDRVSLHLRSHAELVDVLTSAQRGKVGVAIFNLGYLPGGDASIVTQPASTDRALRDAYVNLRPGVASSASPTPDTLAALKNLTSCSSSPNSRRPPASTSRKSAITPPRVSLGFSS